MQMQRTNCRKLLSSIDFARLLKSAIFNNRSLLNFLESHRFLCTFKRARSSFKFPLLRSNDCLYANA